MVEPGWLEANWHAPRCVRAGTTTRLGGVSAGSYASLNLGDHVADDPASVASNRARLATALHLPSEPFWLRQVHGTRVVIHDGSHVLPEADAAVAFEPGRVLAILTADCLPVVFTSRDGSRLGVAHAGWRGLAAGILEATISKLNAPPSELLAWLGPAIGATAFEVGGEVRATFVSADAPSAAAFTENARGRWQADLYSLAKRRLLLHGVTSVSSMDACTFTDTARFYSFRRHSTTGRMATLAWVEA